MLFCYFQTFPDINRLEIHKLPVNLGSIVVFSHIIKIFYAHMLFSYAYLRLSLKLLTSQELVG